MKQFRGDEVSHKQQTAMLVYFLFMVIFILMSGLLPPINIMPQ